VVADKTVYYLQMVTIGVYSSYKVRRPGKGFFKVFTGRYYSVAKKKIKTGQEFI
jgi:hypothetical protein